MGSFATPPDWFEPSDADEPTEKLGDLLSGKLSEVTIDSVEAVREERERR